MVCVHNSSMNTQSSGTSVTLEVYSGSRCDVEKKVGDCKTV